MTKPKPQKPASKPQAAKKAPPVKPKVFTALKGFTAPHAKIKRFKVGDEVEIGAALPLETAEGYEQDKLGKIK